MGAACPSPSDPDSACPLLAGGLACLALFSLPAPAAERPVGEVGPPAPWVDVLTPDYAAAVPTGDDGRSTHHLLVDHQVDVRLRGDEQFRHVAVRLNNDAGADEYSQLTFYANPAYERFTVHWLRVYRDGRLTDRLAEARITVLPVESDLQDRIYRGDMSVNLLVPDLRAGDVLDYAYTTDFVSPNFPEHFAAEISIDWSVPVHRQRIRLRHIADHPVRYRVHGGKAEPSVQTRDGRREIEFNWRDQPARRGEADVPDWYPHWAYVEFTDLDGWSAVAAPTAAMYRKASTLGRRARAQIETLKAMPGGEPDRVLAALRMVQDHVRYASISIGPGSYRPHSPELVLERNFGDCKDKSLLLVSLLRAIGVEASVALVNTRSGQSLPDALPTPNAFDHAIVRVRLGDDVLWLDPTVTSQRGSLRRTAQADFVHALVIDPATEGLATIPRSRSDGSLRDVRLVFDLSAGVEEPATIAVRSRYEGTAADAIRADMTGRSIAERTEDYVNYYAGFYPGIRAAGPVVVEDDTDANVIVTQERYTLERGFRPRSDGQSVFEIFPDELYGYADGTETPIRTAPLAQSYPANVAQSFEVRLPEPWPVRAATVEVDNPAFRYRSAVSHAGNVLKLDYRFESRTDRVAIEDVPKYLADIKRMYDDLGYELTYDEHGGSIAAGVASYSLIAVLLGLLAGLWAAVRLTLRYDPPPRSMGNVEHPRVGIAGWLLLVALNVVVIVGAMLVLAHALLTYSAVDVWEALPATAQGALAPWARHAVAGLQFLAFLLLPSVIVIGVLFFQKRSSAPRLVTALFWGVAIFAAVAEQLTTRLVPVAEEPGLPAPLRYARELVFLLIWTRYLQVSVRVAATFTRRRRVQSAPSGEPPAADALAAR